MAILRQFRDEAVRRVYHQAAVLYFILALVAMGLAALIPPALLQASQLPSRWQDIGAMSFFIIVATVVVWRAHRNLTFLLSLITLYQTINHLLAGYGLRIRPSLEAALPENLADVAALRESLWTELASASPFYESLTVASATPVAVLDPIRSLPLIGGLVPAGGPTVPASMLLYTCAALMAVATLLLWRAVRKRPA
jgi:hypothetical protein